jgi:DNA-binding transcriptional LysR family regulator
VRDESFRLFQKRSEDVDHPLVSLSRLSRLALPPELASHWLAPELGAFRAQHPRVVLHILVGTRQLDLSRGEAELAVRSPRPRQRGLVAARIATTSTALYVSRKVGAYRRLRIASVDSAKAVPLFVFTPALHMLQDAAWFQPLLDSGSIALETNSTHALLAADFLKSIAGALA